MTVIHWKDHALTPSLASELKSLLLKAGQEAWSNGDDLTIRATNQLYWELDKAERDARDPNWMVGEVPAVEAFEQGF